MGFTNTDVVDGNWLDEMRQDNCSTCDHAKFLESEVQAMAAEIKRLNEIINNQA